MGVPGSLSRLFVCVHLSSIDNCLFVPDITCSWMTSERKCVNLMEIKMKDASRNVDYIRRIDLRQRIEYWPRYLCRFEQQNKVYPVFCLDL